MLCQSFGEVWRCVTDCKSGEVVKVAIKSMESTALSCNGALKPALYFSGLPCNLALRFSSMGSLATMASGYGRLFTGGRVVAK